MSENEKKPEKALLRYGEVVKLFNIHPATLWRWEKQGKIKRIPGTIFFSRSEIERFLEVRGK
jgi:DNA-binding transcriptional MerR regulator